MTNAASCYDIICNINSILNLPNGWDFSYTDQGFKRYEEKKDKPSCTVAVVGNANKGKSYILQKLANDEFPSGFAVKTEGLSLKYPKSENLNFILFDTAGLETPLVKEDYYNLEEDFKKEKEKMQADSNETKKEEEDQYIKDRLITNYARDKTITEFFLQSFVTTKSDVLILVMNAMTYSDQILLNKVKKRCKQGRKLFVIHNLQHFQKIEEVEDYIEKTLMKSLTFKLSKLPIVDMGSNSDDTNQKNKYFYREETFADDEEDIENRLNVIHLIMAYDGENSEAGKFYNDTCINFLRIQISTVANIKALDIKNAVKSYFINKAPEFIENEITEENVIEEQRSLILKSESENIEIKLKKCSVDELGDESFQDSKFIPPYRTYETEKKDFFVIELELAGDKTIKPECKSVGNEYRFYISGMKTNPLENEGKKDSEIKKDNYEKLVTKRDEGPFFLSIPVPMQDLPLKSKKVKKLDSKNGIVSLYYELNPPDNDDSD